jgi:hypothetical protein
MQTNIANIAAAAIKVNNTIVTVINLIVENNMQPDKQGKAIIEVYVRVMTIAKMLFGAEDSFQEKLSPAMRRQTQQEQVVKLSAIKDLLYNLGNQMECLGKNNDQICALAKDAWKEGISVHRVFIVYLTSESALLNVRILNEYAKKIHNYESTYRLPHAPALEINPDGISYKTLTGGCYVATCIYGSYDCPQVWTLRRYRDYTLAQTWYGSAFIHTYYAISPTLIKWFGYTTWFKKIWKGRLDRLVANLNDNGVEGSPYEDRN